MGQTLASLVTRIGRGRQNPYSLWLSSQVVVLLSRTKFAKQTTFISKNPSDTAEILFDILKKTSPFREYIAYVLDKLCSSTDSVQPQPTVIDEYHGIYRPRDIALPKDGTGQVYILISIKDPKFTYIGSTNNLALRWRQHNSGFGSQQTALPSLRPWAVLAYVTGFEGKKTMWQNFEQRWIQEKIRLQRNHKIKTSIEGIVDLAQDIMLEMKEEGIDLDLRFVQCGTINYLHTYFTRNKN